MFSSKSDHSPPGPSPQHTQPSPRAPENVILFSTTQSPILNVRRPLSTAILAIPAHFSQHSSSIFGSSPLRQPPLHILRRSSPSEHLHLRPDAVASHDLAAHTHASIIPVPGCYNSPFMSSTIQGRNSRSSSAVIANKASTHQKHRPHRTL